MHLAIFGATGQLGQECLRQSLAAGHTATVLVRTPAKLPAGLGDDVTVAEGNALDASAVRAAMEGADAVLFAIGVDKNSPEDLCTDVTRHILDAIDPAGSVRFVWCGGGSTFIEGDPSTFGARFVRMFAARFLGLRHRDKDHQLELLQQRHDIDWFGVRPLQMKGGDHTGTYRLGMHNFSGMSKISFADCADAMLTMLDDDTWRHQAPIVQY